MFWTRRLLLALDLPPLVRTIVAATATIPSAPVPGPSPLIRAPIRRATPHYDVCLISCAECKPAVQPLIRVLLQSPHPFRHNRAGNLLWMNLRVLQLLVNVYSTVSQSMSRSVLWAFFQLILMARGLTGGGFDSFDAGP